MMWSFSLYLLYGLAFFTLGVAILSRDIQLSELGIARIIWLLAMFGIIHGVHEWLELFRLLFPDAITSTFILIQLAVVNCSFLFLFYFGLVLNIITLRGDRALATTPVIVKAVIGAITLALLLLAFILDFGSGLDQFTRLLVAFPGGLLSGIGLILYSRKMRAFSSGTAANFILAGSCMVCYAVLSGLVPSAAVVPVLEVRVIFFRGLSALLITFFTIRALSVFSIEQKELINEQLQRFAQSEKLTSMGILAAGIAHEINNPLANISLNVELLKDMISDDDGAAKKMVAIERNIERASRIAKELLHFSRERETALVPTDLNQVLTGVRRLLHHQHNASIIRFDLQEIPKIMGISWKLEEVFINLLLNSLDVCSEHDRIDVTTCCRDGRIEATITDTGPGIAPEHLAKVFDPFFTTKEVGKGTGLGLSVCYNIIHQHDGDIRLESDQRGTTATITFPVRTAND